MFVRSIARGSNYRIRSLWINAHIYNLSFHSFFGGEGGRGEDRRTKEWVFMGKVDGWAGIKNGGRGKVVMVKTIIICVRLSVWAQ